MTRTAIGLPYLLGKSYPHRRLKRDGAVMIYYRDGQFHKQSLQCHRNAKPYWVMLLHDPCENGDGGAVYEFVRDGRRWRCEGIGRLRFAHHPAAHVFREKIAELPPRVVV